MFSKLGGGGKPEEEKTVTAGTSVIEVLPSSGKTMKKATVNPTPSQSKTVTPSTSQQTVSPDSGKLLSKVIVKAMEDVTPEVTAQTPMISQILSNLGFTADSASGTNKQKLQTNNANLAKISDYLPHGTYVWKKSIYIDNKDITINVLTTSAPSTMKAVSSDYDLSQVDESFFVGYVGILNDNGTNTRLTFKDGGVLLIEWGTNFSSSSNNTYSYNPSTQVITISSAWSTTPSGTFSKNDETEFIEFVVSDISTAYPDSGIQDLYYYEKVVECIPLPDGMTKIAVDKFSYSSDTSVSGGKTLSHSLGCVPKLWILLAKEIKGASGYQLFQSIGLASSVGANRYSYSLFRYLVNNLDFSQGGSPTAPTEAQVTIYCESGSYYMKAGVEYTLITMA